jgi:hypothetical protein
MELRQYVWRPGTRRSPTDREQRITILVEHLAIEEKRIPDGADTRYNTSQARLVDQDGVARRPKGWSNS